MLTMKPCHHTMLQPTKIVGLEPLELLLLFPGFFLCLVVGNTVVLGFVVSSATALLFYTIKRGHLPGYSKQLLLYMLTNHHKTCFGYDDVPEFPMPPKEHHHG